MSSPVLWNLSVSVCAYRCGLHSWGYFSLLMYFLSFTVVQADLFCLCYSAVGPARIDINQRTTQWKMWLQSNVNFISEILCCSVAVLSGFTFISILEMQLWKFTPPSLTAKPHVHCMPWKANSVWLSNIAIQCSYIKDLWYLLIHGHILSTLGLQSSIGT